MGRNPSLAFRTIKSFKSTFTRQVPYISVGNKQYAGEKVIDGLYESILNLKTDYYDELETLPFHAELLEEYHHILNDVNCNYLHIMKK